MKRQIISTIFTALVLLVGCSTAEDTSVGTMFSDEYVRNDICFTRLHAKIRMVS